MFYSDAILFCRSIPKTFCKIYYYSPAYLAHLFPGNVLLCDILPVYSDKIIDFCQSTSLPFIFTKLSYV